MSDSPGMVVYWMSRDQRALDNWALLLAQHLAIQAEKPLAVVFNVVPTFLNAPVRHFDFMFGGLAEVERDLKAFNIPFFVLCGDPVVSIPAFVKQEGLRCDYLITDFSPMRIGRLWREQVAARLHESCSFLEVDTHNLVPVWIASQKQEWSAATFRSRISKHYDEYLVDIPPLKFHPHPFPVEAVPPILPTSENTPQPESKDESKEESKDESQEEKKADVLTIHGGAQPVDWSAIQATLQCDMSVSPVTHIRPGPAAARRTLQDFLTTRLKTYADRRNLPHLNHLSHLSPYLHYGSISVQRIVLEAMKHKKESKEGYDAFFEELVVRRELSDNFCYYNPKYDQYEGFPEWARKTLAEHANDRREFIYTEKQLEEGKTHDDLWNASQLEMVHSGKMHGYLRMYWAKKILEWTPTPQKAFEIAVRFNDKYELDGRDPNGYVGCAWAIGGVHDRGWTERPIFGKVRFMNYAGCKRKFDIAAYVQRVKKLLPRK
eukprot:TRINITY_DN13260_c0_g1_i3.p1 TRINITY_DN13260_c0_g1~~TRINITY_DN13260_c0_g1_i3.p1  ORF type:complete len:559 (-),score=80.12 TRINITY_DN13260_c0_g1_i3:10-1479(-)